MSAGSAEELLKYCYAKAAALRLDVHCRYFPRTAARRTPGFDQIQYTGVASVYLISEIHMVHYQSLTNSTCTVFINVAGHIVLPAEIDP